MNEHVLEHFRAIADAMFPDQGWQWIGPYSSQRMFGISEQRAKEYARRHGGSASPMPVDDGKGNK
jgi:hypothetical protein